MCECGHECGLKLLEMELVMQNNIQLHRKTAFSLARRKDKRAQDGQRVPSHIISAENI